MSECMVAKKGGGGRKIAFGTPQMEYINGKYCMQIPVDFEPSGFLIYYLNGSAPGNWKLLAVEYENMECVVAFVAQAGANYKAFLTAAIADGMITVHPGTSATPSFYADNTRYRYVVWGE